MSFFSVKKTATFFLFACLPCFLFHKDSLAAEKDVGLPQFAFDTYPSQIFWTVLIFCFFYYVFSVFVIPALSEAIESRNEHIQRDLETARRLKEEAEEIHTAYEGSLKKARTQAMSSFDQAENQMKERMNNSLSKIDENARLSIAKAEEEIARFKSDTLASIEPLIERRVIEATQKVADIKTPVETVRKTIKALSQPGEV